MKKLQILLLVLSVLTSAGLFAQQQVSGVVQDESGAPVIGASIKVKGYTQSPTLSDMNGKFTISCKGDATLVISMKGKITRSVPVGNKQQLTITLLPAAKSIDEVVISASRSQAKLKDLPAKIEVLTVEEISNSKANDMADLLKNNTSVDIIQYPNFLSGIGMRGFAPSTSTKYVSILMDGVPAGTMNMSTLMLNGVQQVEILKGPFSSLYGSSAMAGLINIVPMRHTGDITGAVNLGYGSFKTLKTSAAVGGEITDGLSFDFSAFYNMQDDDYKIGENNLFGLDPTDKAIVDKDSYGEKMKNTTYKANGANLRVGYDFNDDWNIDLYGTYFSTQDVVTNGSFFGVYSPNKKDMNQYTVRLALSGTVNNHTLKFNPYYNRQYYDYADVETNNKTSETTYKTFGFQVQDIISLGDHKLTVGVDNLNIRNEGKSYNAADGVEKMPYQPNFGNTTFGTFAQGNFKLVDDKLNISAGARLDLINLTLEANKFMNNEKKSETYNKFSPNIGVKYEFVDNFNAHASYGMAFLAPNAYQKAGQYTGAYGTTKGNPDLKGETSGTFDIGFAYKFFEQGIDLDVTYFNTNHKDFIVTERVNPDGVPYNGDEYSTFKNANKANMQGLELMASYDFGVLFDNQFSLKTYINGTFMFKTKVEVNDEWKDMKYVRDKTLNFGVQFITDNKWDFKLNGRFIGSRIEDNWYNPAWYPNVRPTLAALANQTQAEYAEAGLLKHPTFMVFDTHLYYNINQNFTVGINANNIFDENYTEKDGYNMPGRSFMGTISFKF